MLGRNRTLCPRREIAAFVGRLDEGEVLPVRIGQRDCAVAATNPRSPVTFAPMLRQTVVPVVVTAGWNRERDLDAEPDAEVPRRRVAEWKEREVRSRVAVGVGVEQMVRVRSVLVDALLHQPHPEHARVEVEILLRVAAIAVMWWMPVISDSCVGLVGLA